MNLRELEAQAEFLAPVIAAAVAKAVAPLNLELAELHKCLADRPMPVEPEPVDLDALAKAAAALVVLPEVKDGKDAAEVDLEALAKAAAALIVLPEVKDGKDAAEVDLAAVAALVEIPAPEKIDLDAIARSAAALIPAPEVKEPEHGRDALELEVLPTIDESKQYPRGTYAAHRGGLWKSYERTHGMRGWECIVEGIDGVTVTQDSVREFSVTLNKSSGAAAVQKFTMPAMVYKGVWRPCEAEPGDMFTFGGSLWHCDEATSEKPGESKAFTLAAKRGKDGNDAVAIKREPPGVVKL